MPYCGRIWKRMGTSQIDDLIVKPCPNGADFRAIGDFGELVRAATECRRPIS